MKIISKISKIEDYQRTFQAIISDNLPTQGLPKKIKRQSQEVADNAIHNDYLWAAFKEESHEGNYWNAFGLMTSCSKGHYNIIAQINFQRNETSLPNGVFAEDKDKKLYILHLGEFTTKGRQHINILEWWKAKNYDIRELNNGQKALQETIILVSPLDSSLVKNITLFVERVRDFKENHLHKFPDN